jgi:adenylate cyclase, class 2
MAHETEIKLHVKDLDGFRRALRKMGARPVLSGLGRVHEWNVVFDTPEKELAGRRELLRIRTEATGRSNSKRAGAKVKRMLLTYKRPIERPPSEVAAPTRPPRHKRLEEIELVVADAGALTKIFAGLGLRGWFCYEKFRSTFSLPTSRGWAKGLLIELDETPIGTFVELEGPARAIDRAAMELGFTKQDYIVANYLSLYREACRGRGEEPGDMLFRKRKGMSRHQEG